MPINTSHLFKLAEALLQGPDEVYFRASASRSFYAAFHVIKPLHDELNDGPELIGGTHENIIQFLKLFPGKFGVDYSRKINQIGITMFGLKTIRTLADYRISEDFLKGEAELAYKLARKIEDRVKEANILKGKAST